MYVCTHSTLHYAVPFYDLYLSTNVAQAVEARGFFPLTPGEGRTAGMVAFEANATLLLRVATTGSGGMGGFIRYGVTGLSLGYYQG